MCLRDYALVGIAWLNFATAVALTNNFSIFIAGCQIGSNGYRAQTENKTFFGRVAETILTKALSNIVVISL